MVDKLTAGKCRLDLIYFSRCRYVFLPIDPPAQQLVIDQWKIYIVWTKPKVHPTHMISLLLASASKLNIFLIKSAGCDLRGAL
jgi:hypothetical protein